MKRFLPYLAPTALLLALLAISVWNSCVMTLRMEVLRDQLLQTDTLAQSEDWASARERLSTSYCDWSAHQTYLHIVTAHSAVDDAEAMYHRLAAYGETEDLTEFRAELSHLRSQLRLLSEMEQFNIKNVL